MFAPVRLNLRKKPHWPEFREKTAKVLSSVTRPTASGLLGAYQKENTVSLWRNCRGTMTHVPRQRQGALQHYRDLFGGRLSAVMSVDKLSTLLAEFIHASPVASHVCCHVIRFGSLQFQFRSGHRSASAAGDASRRTR